ncbi:hypothetical protein [Nocardioides campestrisoli]|uniref:hypothetical protein n=1 Tax=Nocardioides campestrisoli TaxID=2736757 RepID=UPI0015E703AF|nr:hypothetical protein [Nocardioides campestrisoli]
MGDGMVALLFVSVFFLGPPFLVGLAAGWFARGRKEKGATAMALAEVRRLDALVEQIRHDAYEHMTLDSRLAPIVVDTIRSSDLERQRKVARSRTAPPLDLGNPYGQPAYGPPTYGSTSATPDPRVSPPYPSEQEWDERR